MIRLLTRILHFIAGRAAAPRQLDTQIRAASMINDQLADDIAWSIRGDENGLSG